MRLPGARALPVEAEPRLRRRRASSPELLALPENANREPPRPPQEVAHLIREPVRKSGALTVRISIDRATPALPRAGPRTVPSSEYPQAWRTPFACGSRALASPRGRPAHRAVSSECHRPTPEGRAP